MFAVEIHALMFRITQVRLEREPVLGAEDDRRLIRHDVISGPAQQALLAFGHRAMPQIGAHQRIECGLSYPRHGAVIWRIAPNTSDTGISIRHSLILLLPQPSSPQGRQEWFEVSTRDFTCHGPHSRSPLGPNNTTTGVCMALAMCIGTESTPTKHFAWRVSAASCLRLSWPHRSTTGRLSCELMLAANCSSCSAGAAV